MNGSGNVLVVKDECAIGPDVEALGYCVTNTGNNIKRALEILRNERVDLLLIDFNIIEGIEIAEMIRRELEVPVIFLADNYSDVFFERAKKAGAFAYLVRPLTEQQLKINIELALFRHKREMELKSLYKILEASNIELEKKVQIRAEELRKMNLVLRDEISTGTIRSEELEQSEQEYRELFENSHDAILIVDPVSRKIMRINRTACDLYGFSEEEFLKLSINQLYFQEPEEMDYPGLIESAQGHSSFENVHQKRNGQLVYVEIGVSLIKFKRRLALQYLVRDATKRKKAEKALVNSEKRYREMTDFLPIPIFETDGDGVITYCNSMVSELFGYSADELLQKMHLTELIAVREQARMERMFREDISQKKKEGITYTALRKDKSEIKVIGYSVGLYRDNQLKGMRVCLIDIGDLTKTQEQLMKFSMVIEQIGEAVIITDKNGRIEYVNPAFIKQYGYEYEEVLGKKTGFLMSGQHNHEFYSRLWKTISAGNVFSSEFVNKKKNGELYYEDKTIIPLRDAEKNITHFVSTGRNVSDKKLAEKKIFEHQRFIDAINNTVPLIVFVYDIPGKTYTFINNKISSILGYEPEEFIGKNIVKFVEMVHPADRKKLLHIIGQKNYADESVSQVVLKIKQKSGDYRIIEFRGVSFVRNGENSVGQILGTAQDVTEQKYHERRLNAMLRLHRLQEKKEQKIRTISLLQGQEEERRRLSRDMHDGIGQLMTVIKMKLDNIQKKAEVFAPEIADGVRDINGIMKEAITEVRRISNDLVPIGLYDFGLSSVLRQLLESVSGKNIKFFSDIGAARFPSAVEITFYRIFQETINNIQKHSCASSIDVSLVFSNNLLQMTVIDDGIGFVYNDDGPITFVGKGNGLNNMYERACTIGGRYNIQTSPGNGCRITIEVNVKKVKV